MHNKDMQDIVLDTNCLIVSLSRKSPYYSIWKDFREGKYVLCITNEIIAEYEEKICEKMSPEIAANVITAILARDNVRRLNPAYKFHLIEADQMIINLLIAQFMQMQNTS